ncbi:integrase [Pectobacterium brasiliense]|nr:integrase [Pectobacterium brasiliense]
MANQMGHENAQMVYEIYRKWIEDMNEDQVGMLNRKLAR